MKFTLFRLEEWFDRYEHSVDFVLGSSSCASWTLEELFDCTGESIDFTGLSLTATQVQGLNELKEAISTWHGNSTADDVMVTCSSTEAIFILCHAILQSGDTVIAMFPMYQSLYQVADDLGADVKRWYLRSENRFRPDFDELKLLVDDNTKLIVINNPQNPTGITLSREELEQIQEIADRVGAIVFSDEVFRGITVDGKSDTVSIRNVSPQSVATGTMSKTYGMEGLRIGWFLAPQDIIRKCREIRYYTTVCAPVLEQKIATLALQHREKIINRNQKIIDKNFILLNNWIESRSGLLSWVKPQGGPVAFPKFDNGLDTDDFCTLLAEKYGILIPPGKYAFDMEHYFRIGYGRVRNFDKGLERLDNALDDYLD